VEAAAADAAREAAVEAEALRGSAKRSVSADGSANADLEQLARDAARERRRSGQPSTPPARRWCSQRRRARRRRPGRRRPRPLWGPDRGQGRWPCVGWPTLTKTNYVEWAPIVRIRLQVRHMWEAVQYGDVDHHEDRRALDALIAAVPPESGLPRRPGTPSL
jgi:hypothetical protein